MRKIINQWDSDALDYIVAEFAKIAKYLWDKGWAEKNAGNISVNISRIIDPATTLFKRSSYFSLPSIYPHLAGQILLLTSSGAKMRDFSPDNLEHLCFVKLNETGDQCIVWPPECRKPTSELPTHLAVHDMLIRTGSASKALLHSHV